MARDDATSTKFEGTWRLPKFGLSSVGGVYEPGASPALRVFGELWPTRSYDPMLSDDELPPVLGYSAGRRITLLSPQDAGHVRNGDRVSESRILCSTGLIGEHFDTQSDARFSAAQVSLTGSTVFANPPDFVDDEPADRTSRAESVRYEPADDQSAALVEAHISLVDYIKGGRRQWVREWKRDQVFRLNFDNPQSVEEIEFKYIRPLRYLISLGVDRPVTCTAFSVEHAERPIRAR